MPLFICLYECITGAAAIVLIVAALTCGWLGWSDAEEAKRTHILGE